MTLEDYLKQKAREVDNKNKTYSDKMNSEKCSVCGSDKFIQLYRNVVGKIEGSMTGYFLLFGGSISGYISGYTKTLPVLSCRECHNERIIKTWNYTYAKDLFWTDMRDFFFGIYDNNEDLLKRINEVYLLNPIQTREYMIKNKNYNYNFYNGMPYWGTDVWIKAGFKIDKVKKKFLFFTWEVYPKWEQLI